MPGAAITDQASVARILEHLELLATPPPLARARTRKRRCGDDRLLGVGELGSAEKAIHDAVSGDICCQNGRTASRARGRQGSGNPAK